MHIIRKYKRLEQYSKIVLIYDYMMRHVNYSEWAKYINSVFINNKLNSGEIVDISCGTGLFLKELKKIGYKLYGSDNSYDMISRAKSKSNNLGIHYFVMDMRNIYLKKKFDAVVSLFDSINYLITEDDILKNLCSVDSILKDNGLFIFDICTEANSLKNFYNYTEKGKCDNILYTRKSYYIKDERIQVNKFKIIDKNNNENYSEIHKQRIYYPEEIEEIIKESPLKLISMYDDFTFYPPSNKTERIHFVLKKQ